jgi:hypothetical protein
MMLVVMVMMMMMMMTFLPLLGIKRLFQPLS